MAELTINTDEKIGIAKEIDEGAYELIFQAIQEDMYSFPISSFVREAISNGLDAITERDISKDINNGTPVEDYYLQRTDSKLLKDSSFDKSYYNPKYLSDVNHIDVVYKELNPRDTITITDYGVGLGGERLKGFFRLGYSSKRNMKSVIGKFGAGAKAGLATGVDYFIMTTVYNGYKASFMIFKHDYEAITLKTSNGKTEIWTVKMADETIEDKHIYWEKTDDLNGVSITLEVKKHNKSAFIDAVKNQFQYFGGKVHLTYPAEYSNDTMRTKLNDKPLYESDNLLIPQFSTYYAPHILVDGISYGTISWPELELENRVGKIAIKVAATSVDITQSRESLKYTEKTKKVILAAIKSAEEEASEYINTLIGTSDIDDIFVVNNLASKLSTESDGIVSVFIRFLKQIDKRAKVKLKIGTRTIHSKLTDSLFEFLFYKFDVKIIELEPRGKKIKIITETVNSFEELVHATIIYSDTAPLGPKLVKHILNNEIDDNKSSFIYIRPNTTRVKEALDFQGKGYHVEDIIEFIQPLIVKNSKIILDDYDVTYEEDDDLEGAEVENDAQTLAQLRKINKELYYYKYNNVSSSGLNNMYDARVYRKRVECTISIKNLKETFSDGVIISTGKYRSLTMFIEFSKTMLGTLISDNTPIIYVSEPNIKYLEQYGTIITDYFRQLNYKTGELMIGKYIRDLNTIRKLFTIMDKYPEFATKQSLIRPLFKEDIIAAFTIMENKPAYNSLRDIFVKSYNIDKEAVDSVFDYLDTLDEFHKVVRTGDKVAITKSALKLFKSDKIYTIDAYDEELVNLVEAEFLRLSEITAILDELSDTKLPDNTNELLTLLINTKLNANDTNV